MKRVAIYVRVSTQEQSEHGYSIGEQQERLIAFCKAKDWLVHEVYIDGGYTGSNLDRPGIKKLCEDINKFDIVLVYKLDRLSRSQYDILSLIEKTFLPAGVDFVSMSEAFDTSTPFGRAMIGILGVFAQLEREQIRERVSMGRKARAKEGKWHGGASDPLGYDYVGGKLVINENEAEQVRIIFEMAAKNSSGYNIIRTLINAGYTTKHGGWSMNSSRSKVKLIISRPLYYGAIAFGDVLAKGSHEPIVSKELFDKANQMWDSRQRRYGKAYSSGTTLLSGLLHCKHCGAKYTRLASTSSYKGKKYRYYYMACYNRAFPKPSLIKGKQYPKCMNKTWKQDELEAIVESKIRQLAFDDIKPDIVIDKGLDKKKQNNMIKRITDIDKQISKLMELYSVGSVPLDALSSKIEELTKEKGVLKEQLETHIPKDHDSINIEEFKEILGSGLALWDIASLERKRELLSALIRHIIIDNEEVNIEWSFM